jgi:hypothetical protein
MYLLLSAFTSRLNSLLAPSTASVFFFVVDYFISDTAVFSDGPFCNTHFNDLEDGNRTLSQDLN